MQCCPILLVDHCIHVNPMSSSQSWNEFPPNHLNVSLSVQYYWASIIIFKPVWSDYAIVPYGTPHCNPLHTQWSKHMFVRLGLDPKLHVLFVNLSAKMKMCFITKENQVQKVRVVFNSLTDALTKCKPLCLICSRLRLQNLYFVRKHVKVLVHYPNNGCPGQISLLRQTSCGFPWGHCQMFSHIVDVGVSPSRPRSSTLIFILILNNSNFPKFMQEAQNSDSGWSISAREISTKLSVFR